MDLYKEVIYEGVEKLGICGRLRGRFGIFGRVILGRLLAIFL